MEVKDQLKRIVIVLLSVFVALGMALGAGFALADGEPETNHEHEAGEYEVTCWSSPRFPVAGEEAELTCTVLHDGIHDEEVTLSVLLARAEEEHGHGEADDQNEVEAADHDEAEADDHDEAVADDHHHEAEVADHDDGAESTETESVGIDITETDHGIYMAKYTFEQEGKYLGTAQIGNEQADFVVAVRSSPVAWFFMIGLVGVTALVAGVVVVVKTVRRKW